MSVWIASRRMLTLRCSRLMRRSSRRMSQGQGVPPLLIPREKEAIRYQGVLGVLGRVADVPLITALTLGAECSWRRLHLQCTRSLLLRGRPKISASFVSTTLSAASPKSA